MGPHYAKVRFQSTYGFGARPQTQMTGQTMPFRRVCSIYLRDLFSLMDRRHLDTCRQVSAHFDEAFRRYPSENWPQYIIDWMIPCIVVSSSSHIIHNPNRKVHPCSMCKFRTYRNNIPAYAKTDIVIMWIQILEIPPTLGMNFLSTAAPTFVTKHVNSSANSLS